VSQGAHIVCNLNADESNYVDLMGGGDLRMKYNSEGINLTGRYTLSSGEMKYSLPVIPLKTFTVKEGSYVEFTGDPMNPKLNITAVERTK
jgi:autotransporter translocation and assembly factor TamB